MPKPSSDQGLKHAAPRGWWRWLLTASLVVNLAVAGMLAGVMLSRSAPRPPVAAGGVMAIGPLARALSPDDRRALGEAMRADPEFRPRPAEARAAESAALVAAITAVPFDPLALETVMETMRSEGQEAQARSQALLVEHIAAMTDAERAELAARVTEEFATRPGPVPPRPRD